VPLPAIRPPTPMLLVRVASKGLTDAIVVRVANAGLKSVCFHTDSRCLVSVDSSMICVVIMWLLRPLILRELGNGSYQWHLLDLKSFVLILIRELHYFSAIRLICGT